jgi:hypothetical protein
MQVGDFIPTEKVKGVYMLECTHCTREQGFPAANRKQAYEMAGKDGWLANEYGIYCPKDAEGRE